MYLLPQSLALQPARTSVPALLAAVDASQGLILHRLQQKEEEQEEGASSYIPFQSPPGENGQEGEFSGFGWAGLAFDPQAPQRLATVRSAGIQFQFCHS